MNTQGAVLQPDQGSRIAYTRERAIVMKLLGGMTAGSVMLFEETMPAGTKSTFHLHHDSDEIVYVLDGEITFNIGDMIATGGPGACAFIPRRTPHAWKCTGAQAARMLCLYTPAKAGGLIEEQHRTGLKFAAMGETDLRDLLARHGWALLGPSPL